MSEFAYQYVVIRCVPRVERQEFLNVGVALYCQSAEFLGFAWHCDEPRVTAFAPEIDPQSICDGLSFLERVCAGDASVGTAGEQPMGTRFGFVKAPRSTILQPSPVHGGLTSDPAAELNRLMDLLVR